METTQQLTEQIINDLNNKFDEIIIEGLRLKGYSFDAFEELSIFIKENCICADYFPTKQKTFYVKGVPFLLHDYNQIIEPIDYTTRETKITATYGSYKYL